MVLFDDVFVKFMLYVESKLTFLIFLDMSLFFAKIVVWERWRLSPLVTGWLSRSKAQLRARFQLTTASDGWRVPHSCWRPSTLAYWHLFQIMVVIIGWQTIPSSPYLVTTITTRDAQTVTQIVSMSFFEKINLFSGFLF